MIFGFAAEVGLVLCLMMMHCPRFVLRYWICFFKIIFLTVPTTTYNQQTTGDKSENTWYQTNIRIISFTISTNDTVHDFILVRVRKCQLWYWEIIRFHLHPENCTFLIVRKIWYSSCVLDTVLLVKWRNNVKSYISIRPLRHYTSHSLRSSLPNFFNIPK